jgi:DNA-binding IclR family transcriptional regulator
MSRVRGAELGARLAARREWNDAADPNFVAALGRGMAVLEAFDTGHASLGNQEIAQRTGLPKASVSRLATTLGALGYLAYDSERQKYRLGARLMRLTANFLGTRGVRDLFRPAMESLAARLHAPVALTERDGLEMVYIEYCRADATVIVLRKPGSRVPLGASAAGRAYLAACSRPERDALAAQLRLQHGRDWPELERGLAAADRDLATLGFCRSYGNWNREVNAVAVPLCLPVDGALAVLNLAAPAALVPAPRFDREYGPALRRTVEQLRAALPART